MKKDQKKGQRMKEGLFDYYFKCVFPREKIKIYELRHELNVCAFLVFSFLRDEGLDRICMATEQALKFCQEFPLEFEKNSTYVLLKLESDFYLVDIAEKKNEMFVSAHSLDKALVVRKGQRIIVPGI